MTASESYSSLNPGWVNEAPSPISVINSEPSSESVAPIATDHTEHFTGHTSVGGQEVALPEQELQLLKRLGYSYQVLASSIMRAKQAQQELRNQLNLHKHAIGVAQQELQEILTQLAAQQTTPAPLTIAADEAELATEFAQLQEILKTSHYESLLAKLQQMQTLVETDRQNLPSLLTAMRSELDLVILQALRLSALENLNAAYKKYRQFQAYNSRAEQEFQTLAHAFTLN
jgi:plasmid stability protein